MEHRRYIVGASLIGMATMVPVTLLQAGIVRHLPDPPFGAFNSDKTILSKSAFRFGVPDGALALASLALNVPLALYGQSDRPRRQPIVPMLLAAKTLVDAIGAGFNFWKMASKHEPWCAYCVIGALVNFSLVGLTLPQARQAGQLFA